MKSVFEAEVTGIKGRIGIYFGEFFGTFLLVLFGTSAVSVAVLFNAFAGLFQVATIWGIGVTLAIYATRHLSCAHLNPAVSLGMVLAGRMHPRLLLPYWLAQLIGAVAAGCTVLLIFGTAISEFFHRWRADAWRRFFSMATCSADDR